MAKTREKVSRSSSAEVSPLSSPTEPVGFKFQLDKRKNLEQKLKEDAAKREKEEVSLAFVLNASAHFPRTLSLRRIISGKITRGRNILPNRAASSIGQYGGR